MMHTYTMLLVADFLRCEQTLQVMSLPNNNPGTTASHAIITYFDAMALSFTFNCHENSA